MRKDESQITLAQISTLSFKKITKPNVGSFFPQISNEAIESNAQVCRHSVIVVASM